VTRPGQIQFFQLHICPFPLIANHHIPAVDCTKCIQSVNFWEIKRGYTRTSDPPAMTHNQTVHKVRRCRIHCRADVSRSPHPDKNRLERALYAQETGKSVALPGVKPVTSLILYGQLCRQVFDNRVVNDRAKPVKGIVAVIVF
jgi:hypothetical protein